MDKNREIKAIVWDFGDTLVTLAPSREELFMEAASRLGLRLSSEVVREAYRIVDFSNKYSSVRISRYEEKAEFYRNYNRHICTVLGILSRFHELQPLIDETFKKRKRWDLVHNACSVLEGLNRHGIPMVIAANWDNNLAALAESLGIGQFFRAIIASQDFGIEKPDPRIFHYALQNLEFPGGESVLYIGNEYESDVIGARAAGLVPVLIDRNKFYPYADCLRFDSIVQWRDALIFEGTRIKIAE